MTLVKGLVEDLFEDIADVTLIDEDTKPILTDDDNKERGFPPRLEQNRGSGEAQRTQGAPQE